MASLPEQGSGIASPDVTLKYKEILRSNGIMDDVSEVVIKDAGLKGEGLTGLTSFVTVTFKNPDLKQLNLFVKIQADNQSAMGDLKLFEKEAVFLREYVPAAAELCKSKGLDGVMDFYPKAYYANEKMIVLENLVTDKGYAMLDKEKKQDLSAAKLAIQNLAKHHAISYAMIREHGGADSFFQRFQHLDFDFYTTETFREMVEPMLLGSLHTNIELLKKHSVEEGDKAIADLKALSGKAFELILKAINAPATEATLMVLNHGDYWNNNMMFLKEPGTDKLIHHVAIDFQVTSYSSLVFDLGYYLFTSVQTEVRRAHLKYLLKLYVETFNKLASDLGHPVNLTFEQVFLEFRRKLDFGFCFGACYGFEPTLAIMKDVDVNEIEISQWAHVFGQLVQKWFEEHPDQLERLAKETVAVMDEYRQLSL